MFKLVKADSAKIGNIRFDLKFAVDRLFDDYGVEITSIKDFFIDNYILRAIKKDGNLPCNVKAVSKYTHEDAIVEYSLPVKIVSDVAYGVERKNLVVDYLKGQGYVFNSLYDNNDFIRIMYDLHKKGIKFNSSVGKIVEISKTKSYKIFKGGIFEMRGDYVKAGVYKNRIELFKKSSYLGSSIPKKNNAYKLMVFDIETYLNQFNEHVAYAVGYSVFNKNMGNYDSKYFYYDEYRNEEQLIYNFLNSILIKKYNGYIVYAHNMVNYDMKILFDTVAKYFEIQPIVANKEILGYKVIKGDISLTFKDSYKILPASLDNLGKSFGVVTLKSQFPYKFITEERLKNVDHKEIPKITDYVNMSEKTYNEEIRPLLEYNIKIQTLQYLKNDLDCLLQCLIEFNQKIFDAYHINTFDHYTLSGLAFKIFRTKYMLPKSVPSFEESLNKSLRAGYTGGVVDVFRPVGRNLYCYDVNSLYPHIMKGYFPSGDYSTIEFDSPVPFNKG